MLKIRLISPLHFHSIADKAIGGIMEPARRINLSLDIEYRKSYARSSNTAQLQNISLSGAFIKKANEDFKKNEKVALTFELGGRIRQISATIVWVNPFGAGINFQHINNQDQQIIDDLMFYVEEQKEDKKSILDNIFSKVG